MGFQAQVDFGQTWQKNEQGQSVKLYVVAFVLSHSRYKYMEWLDRPFTTNDLIEAHKNAFHAFGGKPKEIVYDQDNIIIVSENNGDIIYTKQFESYRREEAFQVYACRGSDPESKGKIENVIGFIKNNFAKHRVYTTLDNWNQQGACGSKEEETVWYIIRQRKNWSMFSRKKNDVYDQLSSLSRFQPMISKYIQQI